VQGINIYLVYNKKAAQLKEQLFL